MSPVELEMLESLAIALGLGMLVGLQRESVDNPVAGLRTFGLITVLGALAGILSPTAGSWLPIAALVALAAFSITANILVARTGEADPGTTTEVAAILMFLIGVWIGTGQRTLAVVLGAAVAVILQAKQRLSGIVDRLGERDVEAIMRFALLSLVILPILPDRTFGPYDVVNLRETWLMVVLIVGLGLAGYIAYKFLGADAGVMLGGIMGGAISSTATTVSYARKTKTDGELESLAATVIIIANTVVWVRLLIEVGLVAPAFLPVAAGPLGVMLAAMVVTAALFWWRQRHERTELPEQENPSEMKSALVFAALYAIVLVGVAFAKDVLGNEGLYIVAVVAGLTDVDAITLSTSRLVREGVVGTREGWTVILLASLSNMVFKLGAVAILGSRALVGRIAAAFGVIVAIGVVVLVAWP
jgi:uncharacterized membrane protein (DUF4010 family)